MKKKIFIIVLLFLIFALALFLRVHFCQEEVFSYPIKYSADDGIYHMRLVENELLGNHFPKRIYFDPYTNFPQGTYLHFGPFYDQLLAGTIWLAGLGNPTQELIDKIAPFFPAILGSFIIFIAYFIGRKIWSKEVGLLSAFLMAISAPYLGKSILGNTDHHFAEVLFSALVMMFLIFALKERRNKKDFKRKRFWLWTVLAGFSLGLYFLTWTGALLFLFIIFSFILLYFLIEYLSKREPPFWILTIGIVIFSITLLMLLPFLGHPDIYSSPLYNVKHLESLIFGILGFIFIWTSTKILRKKNKNPWFLAGLIVIAIALLYLILKFFFPFALEGLINSIKAVNIGVVPLKDARQIISEMAPLTFKGAINYFSYSFYLALIALILILFRFIKKRKPEELLIFCWTIVIVLMAGIIPAIGQNRFSVYLSLNVSLLIAFLAVEGFKFGWQGLRKAESLPSSFSLKPYLRIGSTLIIFNVIFFLCFPFPLNFFNKSPDNMPDIFKTAFFQAKNGPHKKHQDWYRAMEWLKNNTPDPGLDYYALYPESTPFSYPESAYGILARWDIGHMLTYYAHRLPVSNPFQQGIGKIQGDYVEPGEATFFLETDENKATGYLDQLKTRYAITDFYSADPDASFKNLVKEIEGNLEEYYEFGEDESSSIKTLEEKPSKYDNSIIVRLHTLDGKGYKDEAQGVNIPALSHFRLVWESDTTITFSREDPEDETKLVKIFEYVKGAKIKGKTEPGTNVLLSSEIETNQKRKFVYQKELETKDGFFEFIVPYSTEKEYLPGQTEYWVFASPYKLKTGEKQIEINISEKDILQGRIIEVSI